MRIRVRPAAARLGIVAMGLLIWEAGARWFGDPLFISPPSRVAAALFQLAHDREVGHLPGEGRESAERAFVCGLLAGLESRHELEAEVALVDVWREAKKKELFRFLE